MNDRPVHQWWPRVRKTDGETVTVTAGEVERLRVRAGSSSDRIFSDEG